MNSGQRTQRRPWLQFRLASLMVAKTACALALAVVFAILPRYVDGVRLVSGQIMIHLTPAAQQLLFDPPAPMGPMHETKVFLLSSVGYNMAALLGAVTLIAFCVRVIPRVRLGRGHCRVLSRTRTALAGVVTGALVGGMGFAVLLRTLDGVPHAALVGSIAGALSGVALARRGIELACIIAGLASFLFGTLGTMVITAR